MIPLFLPLSFRAHTPSTQEIACVTGASEPDDVYEEHPGAIAYSIMHRSSAGHNMPVPAMSTEA